jgi:hypothetical protein
LGKLTKEQVSEISMKFAIDTPLSELAKEYGVTIYEIRDILVFYTYSTVTSQLELEIKEAILAGNSLDHEESPSVEESHEEKPKSEKDIGMTRQVASAVLKGSMNADIVPDLTMEEMDRLQELIEFPNDHISQQIEEHNSAPQTERDFIILRGILTTNKPYSQLAKEAGVAPSYISLLIKGEQGKTAWDMLNQQEAKFIRKISKSPSFRDRLLKTKGEVILN